MRDAHTLGPPPGAPIIWVLWEGSSCVWWVAGWGWPRHRGGVRPLGDCCWWGRMEGGPASLGDRKSHPSFWSWKRCTEPCRRLQVASFLLNSHSPPLPPSSSVPHISGTSFHLPPFLSSSRSPSLSPGSPQDPHVFIFASAPCSLWFSSTYLSPFRLPSWSPCPLGWEVTPHTAGSSEVQGSLVCRKSLSS